MSESALVGTRKGLFEVKRDGVSWAVAKLHHPAVPVSMVFADPRDGSWFAALDHGHFGVKVQRSRDAGETWTEIAAPAYPERPAGLEDDVPWSLKLIWALEAGAGQRIWCGTIPGGVFSSDDSGDSWQLVDSLWSRDERREWFGGGADQPGAHSICIDPRDHSRVIVGVSCGGVWHSEDDGQSWTLGAKGMKARFMPPDRVDDERIQDPHHLAQSPSDPDVVWAQHHNGIFRSTDHGRSWTEITEAGPSTFGFACAVHPRDADTAWFVPADSDASRLPVDGKVVVTRTRDGGKSFDVLREGLPDRHAYDIVYRHAFEVAEDGNTLLLGSTTGNLWASGDQGDSWTTVSNHLPPVYCLRFL